MARRRAGGPDIVLATILGLAVLVVHDVPYMLSQPLWTDESWVAVSTRLPLSDLPLTTASTPIGWSLLLRVVFVGGPERYRLVPLAAAGLTAAAAYYLGVAPAWPTRWLARLSGVLAGLMALTLPSAMFRDDLKQYTTDAFVALLILVRLAAVEAGWTRRRVIALGATVVAGFLVSDASAFVGVAALGSLLLITVAHRSWPRLAELAVVAGSSAALLAAIYLAFYRPNVPPSLTEYWGYAYLPISGGWAATWAFLRAGTVNLVAWMGTGSVLLTAVLLAAGVVTLVRLRRPALALSVPLLMVGLLLAGALKLYPLFDLRTSHFLTTVLAVTAAIGAAGLAALLVRISARRPAVGSTAVLTLAAALFLQHNWSLLRTHSIIDEDIRTPTYYVADHRQPGDIVVVEARSNWGFGYYWPHGQPIVQRSAAVAVQFVVVQPPGSDIVVAASRSTADVDAAMEQAATLAKGRPAGRIWLVSQQHLTQTWTGPYLAFARDHGLATTEPIPGVDLMTRG